MDVILVKMKSVPTDKNEKFENHFNHEALSEQFLQCLLKQHFETQILLNSIFTLKHNNNDNVLSSKHRVLINNELIIFFYCS